MGQFAIILSGVGGHGCSREVTSGGHVLGCQRPECPDCIAREMVRRLKRNGITELEGRLIHWPQLIDGHTCSEDSGLSTLGSYALVKPSATSVVDDLVTGVRAGSF